MSKPLVLQDDFSLGMAGDTPRHQLPKGRSFRVVDWIPELGAPLVKRGGWTRPFDALAAGSYMAGIGFAPFSGGASRVLAINDAGTLYKMTPGSATATSVGSARTPAHPPTFYRDNAIICDVAGAAVPYRYDNSTLTVLTGSPPNGALSCAFKDHLVLARSSANTNRVWFSNLGDMNAWDTAADGQWLDTTYPIQGLAAMRNMILVFGEGWTERIRGDVIPGNAAADMVIEPLFSIGCSDPGSVVVTDDFVVFANSAGVYITDGSAVASLTEQGGIDQLWRSTLASYAATWTLAACFFRGRYIIAIMDGSTFKASFMCDVKRRVWSQLTNVKALMMVSSPIGILDTPPQAYFADRSSLYTGSLASMFTPGASVKNDGDGTAVTPVLETPHYIQKPGSKRWGQLYVKHHISDAASDNPTLTLSYQTDLVSSSYTALSTTLAENTAHERERVPLRVKSEGVQLKIHQTNASAETRLYGLEADVMAQEPSRG
jgi:hypothetical protein